VRRQSGSALRDSHLFQARRRAEAFERMTAIEQLAHVPLIDLRAFALPIRSVRSADVGALVPRKTTPMQRVENRLFALARAASLIGILNAQHKLSAVVLGEAIIDERDIRRADMRVARRRRRNPSSDFQDYPISMRRLTDELASLTALVLDEVDDIGQRGAGGEDCFHAGFAQFFGVFRWDRSAAEEDDVPSALRS
jgi:hypothetical protein